MVAVVDLPWATVALLRRMVALPDIVLMEDEEDGEAMEAHIVEDMVEVMEEDADMTM